MAFVVVVAACSSSLPDAYTLVDEPYVAPPSTDGECALGYASQVATLDPATGAVTATAEIPHFGRMIVDGGTIIVGYGPVPQPSGAIGFGLDLQIRWQAEFPGHLYRVGRESPPLLLEPGKALLWGINDLTTNIIVIDTGSGEQLSQGQIEDVFTPPLLVDGVLIAANADQEAHGIDLATGETLWTRQLDSEYAGNAVVAGGNIYLPGWIGYVLVLDSSGERVGWYELPLDHVTNVLAVGFGNVVATGWDDDRDGQFIVSLDLDTGSGNWRTPYGENEIGVEQVGAAVAYGLPGQGVQSLELSTGNVLWRFFGESAEAVAHDSFAGIYYSALERDDGSHLLAAISGPGSLDWDLDLPGYPTVVAALGDEVIVGGFPAGWRAADIQADDQGWLNAYSSVDGSLLWSTTLREAPRQIEATSQSIVVATADQTVFCD